MATNGSQKNSIDTGTKIVIGLAAVALLFALFDGAPEDDAWDGDDTAAVKESGTGSDAVVLDESEAEVPVDDPWTRGGPPDEGDDEAEVPVDDPWTRGSPAGGDGGGDDEPEVPVDDPWTRGSPADDGGGDEPEVPADDPWTRGTTADTDDGELSVCAGTMEYRTDDGRVRLPTDRPEDEWASADCTLSRGQSGGAVVLVQVALTLCNGQRIPIDGVNGEATRLALANVQSAHGIHVDGGYGPATREVMAWPTDPADGGSGLCVPQPDVG